MPNRKVILLTSFIVVIGLLLLLGIINQRVYLLGSNGSINNKDLAVLVLGEVAPGQGGRWHHAPDLTDSIFLVYYRPETGTVNLISLPRDLYGEFGGETFKINELARRNKINDLLAKLPEITGVPTNKFVIVDLGIVKQVVDGLGGIEVDLPTAVTDSVSGFTLPAGHNHLGGDDAAWLVRNRFAPEGDFFRERNQHLVIKAIFERLGKLDVRERTEFFFRVLPEVGKARTNFNLSELIPRVKAVGAVQFNSIVLDFSTGLLESTYVPVVEGESAYVLVPREGINNYKAIREFITARIR